MPSVSRSGLAMRFSGEKVLKRRAVVVISWEMSLSSADGLEGELSLFEELVEVCPEVRFIAEF